LLFARRHQLQAQHGTSKILETIPELPRQTTWGLDADYGDAAQITSLAGPAAISHKPEIRITGISNRKLKKLRPSPTANLIAAIQAIDPKHPALPPSIPSKIDLSYVNPKKGTPKKRTRLIKPQESSPTSGLKALGTRRTGLTNILAHYIRSTPPVSQRSLRLSDHKQDERRKVLNLGPGSKDLVDVRGYTEEDIKHWASIVTARNVQHAVNGLYEIRVQQDGKQSRLVPDSVFLFVLRRPDINGDALRKLIELAWYRFDPGRNTSAVTNDINRQMDVVRKSSSILHSIPKPNEMTVIIAVIRLLRHARRVWPESMTNIIQLITKCLEPYDSTTSALRGTRYRRLSFLYNRLLSLLSKPSSINPLASVVHRQRAQFTLVQRMMEFDPPVLLEREGYRAIITVQAAHKKTSKEEEWADLKAHSWPPWKYERTGLDVDKGIDLGITRSAEVIHQLEEAGYPSQSWEQMAKIYSGWDTDDTPTIQTRAILGKPSRKHGVFGPQHTVKASTVESHDIWAARIRSTRTVQEAWACFLALQDISQPSSEAYFAMFEKIVFSRMQRKHRLESRSSVHTERSKNTTFPGDGKETFPAPLSPHEAIYISSSPPLPQLLFSHMLDQGIVPSVRCTAFLVSHSESLAQGVFYLRKAPIHPAISHAMVNVEADLPVVTNVTKDDMDRVPRLVSAALIRLLCRFSRPSFKDNIPRSLQGLSSTFEITESEDRYWKNPFLQALSLLRLWSPAYRPPWNDILSALAAEGTQTSVTLYQKPSRSRQLLNDLLSWRYIQNVVAGMSRLGLVPDIQTFQFICIGLQKAASAAYAVQELEDSQLVQSAPVDRRSTLVFRARSTLRNGARYLRSTFESLVGCHMISDQGVPTPSSLQTAYSSSHSPTTLPKLLVVPGPAQLHAYIRVLGRLQEWDDLLGLIQWIRHHSPEIEAAAQEAKNGKLLMRRSIVAVRVFLEQSRTVPNEPLQTSSRADGEDSDDPRTPWPHARSKPSVGLLHQIRHEIDQLENWGGWPTEDEVGYYVRRARVSRATF
jgi:hypothetical protein